MMDVKQNVPYEKIIFQQKKVTVVDHWPVYIQLSLKLLVEGTMCNVTDAGKIQITVDNGWAVYRLTKQQTSEFCICLELEDEGK